MTERLDDLVKEMLEARRGHWPAIAKAAGVSTSWISQFVRGIIKNPGIETLRKLFEALKRGGGRAW